MLRKWGTLVLLLLAAPTLALAQSTGKIAGSVVDAETGESLPGASVILEGTSFGAATDIDGQFEIFEVPPGTYVVVTSYTGYATERRDGVEIIAGITNPLNFQLRPATVELDIVEVTAERPLVNVTATNAVRRMGREELASLPTRNAQDVIGLQPGVTVLNDEVFIRGGRPDETEFLLEGISSRSLVGGDNVVPVISEALEEIQVLAGGYSAEYGGANAGIVQQVLRTGGSQLSGMLQFESDAPAGALGETHSYGYNDITATLGGPLIWNKHRFFGAVNYSQMDNWDPMFWYGADLGTPVDRSNPAAPDTAFAPLAWDDGALPGINQPREQLKVNGTLSFDFSPLRLRLSYAHLQGNRRNNTEPVFNIYNQERVQKRDDLSQLASAQATYFLNPSTYLEANVGYFNYALEVYDPIFGSPEADGKGGAVLDLVDWWDREAVREALGGDTPDADLYTRYWQGRYIQPDNYLFNAFEFARPGDVDGNYTRRNQSYYDLGLSLTSQQENHYLVAGGNFRRWTVRDYRMSGATLASSMENPATVAAIQAESDSIAQVIRLAGFGGYGYDEFMNKTDDGPNAAKRPVTAALYINDRIEFEDIILNAGLRYDFFDMDLWNVDDPANPAFNEGSASVDNLKKAPGKGYLQPRLGLSFPVTDQTAFHLQYGKFAQMPDMFFAYRDMGYIALVLGGQNLITTPFAWDLDPIRSTQYEIGVGHQFSEFAAFDVTAFYRKTEGQLEIIRQETVPGAAAANYNLFVNGDFAIARGIELALRTTRIGGFMAMLNYTLTDAKGTNSEPGGQLSALENGTPPPTLIQPLTFEERHRGSAILDFRTGQQGSALSNDWAANLLFTFHSGHRFTRSTGSIGQQSPSDAGLLEGTDTRTRIPLEPLNSSTTPWFFNTDLRVEKGFDFGAASATVYGYVENVFNTKNVINVYLRSGNSDTDGFMTNPELSEQIIANQGAEYVRFYDVINNQNREHYLTATGDDLWAAPRQLRLGVRVEF